MLNREQKDKLKLIVESIDDKLTREGYIFTARHFDVVMDGIEQLLKQCNVSGALPTKEEIIAEAKSIYKEMNSSTEAEAVRQAETAKLMFIAGAWFSRGFKGNDR